MSFRRYSSGSIVAEIEYDNNVVLKTKHSGGLLRIRNGVPNVVIERADLSDVAAIFACLADGFDRSDCAKCGVEVEE